MATDAEVREAIKRFPGASEEKIQKAMKNYGVSPAQLARVRGQIAAEQAAAAEAERQRQAEAERQRQAEEERQSSGPSLGFTGSDVVEDAATSNVLNSIPGLKAAYNIYKVYKNYTDKKKAESQKRDNLFYLTLDEMRKAGEDPYEQYPVELFDVSKYKEFEGIGASGTPEEMQREAISAAIYNWRERNNDIVQAAYDVFLESGLDYDEYNKRQEESGSFGDYEVVTTPTGYEGEYTDVNGTRWGYSDSTRTKWIISEPEEEEENLDKDTDLTDNGGNNAAAELEREQAVNAVKDWLERNPNATAADIQARLDKYAEQGIDSEGIFAEATGGKAVNDYVSERDASAQPEPEPDDNVNPERPWIFQNGVMTNVITGVVVTPPDPSLYTEGEYYSGAGSEGMNPEERKQAILDWIDLNPNATVEEIRRAMGNNNVTDEEFKNATGKTPEEIAAETGTGTDTGDGTDTGTDTGDGTDTGTDTGDGTDTGTDTGDGTDTGTDTGDGTDTQCGEGYRWDEASQSCVLDDTGDGGGDTECGEGYRWDEASQSCVPDDTGTGNGTGNGTGDGTGDGTGNGLGGLFSGTRTTDAILGADLQKIDANFPIIGQLVQYPGYQPTQYLLQGISQRFTV